MKEPLTKRELQVLKLILQNKSVKEIAIDLSLSKKTVGAFRSRINYKLECNGVLALLRVALRRGLFTVQEFMSSNIGEGYILQPPT